MLARAAVSVSIAQAAHPAARVGPHYHTRLSNRNDFSTSVRPELHARAPVVPIARDSAVRVLLNEPSPERVSRQETPTIMAVCICHLRHGLTKVTFTRS